MTTCALGAQVSSSFHGWMTGLQPENDRLTRSSAGEYRDFGKPGEPSLGSAANNKYRPGSQYGDAALSQKVCREAKTLFLGCCILPNSAFPKTHCDSQKDPCQPFNLLTIEAASPSSLPNGELGCIDKSPFEAWNLMMW